MNLIFRLRQYLRYQWRAQTKYYIHSPFVYPFYLNVLEGIDNEAFKSIHLLRERQEHDNTLVRFNDLGAGTSKPKSISEVAKGSAVTDKYARVLYRLTSYFKPKCILELGTSIGLSSSYLALGNPSARVITIEGSTQLARIAAKNHSSLNITNIEIEIGDFEDTLPQALADLETVDMVFFDGNHRKEATLKYFNQCLQKATSRSIFVFDDIYWSREMSEAWELIKQHPRITLTIDIYRMGICFFTNEKLAKENFVLRY